MTREDVFKKVKDLLRLAENNDNLAEATLAFGKAQELLSKYNLSMSDIEHDLEAKEAIEEQEGIESNGRMASWKKALASSIARANQCFSYTKMIDKSTIKVVGRPSDIQIVNYMYLVISREIERLCKVNQPSNLNKSSGKIWSNSFKIGAVKAISDRFNEVKKQSMENADEKAIVRVEKRFEEAKTFAYKNEKIVTKGSSYRKNEGAYGAGYKSGQQIHANSGLGSGKGHLALGGKK